MGNVEARVDALRIKASVISKTAEGRIKLFYMFLTGEDKTLLNELVRLYLTNADEGLKAEVQEILGLEADDMEMVADDDSVLQDALTKEDVRTNLHEFLKANCTFTDAALAYLF